LILLPSERTKIATQPSALPGSVAGVHHTAVDHCTLQCTFLTRSSIPAKRNRVLFLCRTWLARPALGHAQVAQPGRWLARRPNVGAHTVSPPRHTTHRPPKLDGLQPKIKGRRERLRLLARWVPTTTGCSRNGCSLGQHVGRGVVGARERQARCATARLAHQREALCPRS